MDPRPPAPLNPWPSTAAWLALGEVQSLLLESYTGAVFCLGLDGRIDWLNPAGSRRLGHGPGELVGHDFCDCLLGRDQLERRAKELAEELGEPVAAGFGVLGERLRRGIPSDAHGWVLRHKDGSPQPTRLAVGALRDRAGEIIGLIAIEPAPFFAADDDARLHLTHHDGLTGLPTRAVLADRAEMAIQRSARQHSLVSTLLVEIAGFEDLCKQYGYSVGDDLLRATASRLHFELRKTDTAVRMDGGQFAALLVDLHTAEEARLIAAKVQQALSAKVNVGVAILPLTVRIGVAWFPAHGDQLLPLLQAADGALQGVTGERGGVACAPLSAN